MVSKPTKVAEFTDKYGDTRVVHRDKGGILRLAQQGTTPVLALNRAAAILIGNNIRRYRELAGLTLEELCLQAGLASQYPKSRMWEIEKGSRKGQGIRMGTLYAIAYALHISPADLLPCSIDVFEEAGVKMVVNPPVLGFEK